MKIVTTFHSPSSVLSSVKCRLGASDVEHLVVAKINRIEVYTITSQGLQLELTTEIWGKVLTIKAIPIPGSSRSNLLLMISHPDPELVFFTYTESENGVAELTPKKQLSLKEPIPRPAEFFNDVLVHPSGKLAVVSCYTGKLKFIKLRAGNYDADNNDFDITLPELNLLSLAYLPTYEDEYTLAILYLDHQGRIQLHARDIIVRAEDVELSSKPSTSLYPTAISNKIIPDPTYVVPRLIPLPAIEADDEGDDDNEQKFLGGVLIVGGKKILLYELVPIDAREKQRGKRRRLEEKKKSNDPSEVARAKEKEREREGRKRKAKASVEWPWSEVTTWCAVEPNSQKFFIGDAYGKLSLLSAGNIEDIGLILVPLGETSPATTISYLTNQCLYIGSHLANSQIIQISATPLAMHTTPTLPIPSSVPTFPPNHLVTPKTTFKGKGRAFEDSDMDIDNDSGPDTSKGCVIKTMGTFVNVLESYTNIAPIVDAVMVDTDGSGQSQIITCSGSHGFGSINVVRSGADFEELAIIPIEDVVRLWSIRNMTNDEFDSMILVSTLHKTYLLRIGGNNEKPAITYVRNTMDLVADQPTLAFSNILVKQGTSDYADSAFVVQVTPKGVELLEFNHALGGYSRIDQYPQAESEVLKTVRGPIQVVCASANRTQVALALAGGYLVLLSVSDKTIREQIFHSTWNEISAISCQPTNLRSHFSNFVTVAYWETNVVEVFRIKGQQFNSVSKTDPLSSVVRSVMLFNFEVGKPKGSEYLLAGLGDGTAVYFNWKNNGEIIKHVEDKKVVSLGHRPVSLTPYEAEGKPALLATGDRSTILSWERERLSQFPIMSKGIVAATTSNAESFLSTLILATSKNLSVGRVRNLDKMNIRSIPFGPDDPRRIAYEPNHKLFALACTRTEPARIGEAEVTKSSFKVVDDNTFTVLNQFNCEPDEEISAISSISISVGDEQRPFFCVATYTYRPEEKEPTSGRLLIFAPFTVEASAQNRTSIGLTKVCSFPVKGCVYSLVVGQDKIFAAVNSSVVMFQLVSTDDVPSQSYELKHLSEWNHNYLVVCLALHEDHIVAADQISSISLLKVKDTGLQSVARDYGPLWPVSVEALSNEHIIGGNDAFNLFTFTLSRNLGRAVLERDGSYHLGDFVTKFVRGSLSSSDVSNYPALVQEAVFFTSSGRIGVVIGITDDQLSLHLTELQRNLGSVIPAVGGVSHASFRAPRNSRGRSDADSGAFGFMDGDFLEQFLPMIGSQELVEKVMAGQSEAERLTNGVDELKKLLETLQGLH